MRRMNQFYFVNSQADWLAKSQHTHFNLLSYPPLKLSEFLHASRDGGILNILDFYQLVVPGGPVACCDLLPRYSFLFIHNSRRLAGMMMPYVGFPLKTTNKD